LSSGRVIVKIPKLNIPYKYVEPKLIPIDQLLIHEEIVEGRLNDLIQQFLRDNAIDMPIIVAEIPGTDKYLIVDGHHRWAAAKILGLKYMPCVVIDYFSDDVKLMTWYPAIIGDIDVFIKEAHSVGLEIHVITCEHDNVDKLLEISAFIVIGREKCYMIPGGIEEQRKVSRILSDLNVKGHYTLVYYGDREEALNDLLKGEITYLFLRRNVTKEDVIKTVLENKVYPPKTTRHILPFYPAKTYTSLELLK